MAWAMLPLSTAVRDTSALMSKSLWTNKRRYSSEVLNQEEWSMTQPHSSQQHYTHGCLKIGGDWQVGVYIS